MTVAAPGGVDGRVNPRIKSGDGHDGDGGKSRPAPTQAKIGRASKNPAHGAEPHAGSQNH